jgi:hypothetical protein
MRVKGAAVGRVGDPSTLDWGAAAALGEIAVNMGIGSSLNLAHPIGLAVKIMTWDR